MLADAGLFYLLMRHVWKKAWPFAARDHAVPVIDLISSGESAEAVSSAYMPLLFAASWSF